MNKAMEKLRLYYEKNFAIPASIPLYGEKIKRGGEGEGAMPRGEATKRVEELYRQIVITESFNDRKRRELKQIEVMREREREGEALMKTGLVCCRYYERLFIAGSNKD